MPNGSLQLLKKTHPNIVKCGGAKNCFFSLDINERYLFTDNCTQLKIENFPDQFILGKGVYHWSELAGQTGLIKDKIPLLVGFALSN